MEEEMRPNLKKLGCYLICIGLWRFNLAATHALYPHHQWDGGDNLEKTVKFMI